MGENRLFAFGLTFAMLGLGVAIFATRGFGDKSVSLPAGALGVAEGVLLETSADRTHFTLHDEMPAAKAELKRVFGLTTDDDAPVAANAKLECTLAPELNSFAGFLHPGAHYRVHYKLGTKPSVVTRIEPIVTPLARREGPPDAQ
jgi:hypothetical protein